MVINIWIFRKLQEDTSISFTYVCEITYFAVIYEVFSKSKNTPPTAEKKFNEYVSITYSNISPLTFHSQSFAISTKILLHTVNVYNNCVYRAKRTTVNTFTQNVNTFCHTFSSCKSWVSSAYSQGNCFRLIDKI